MTTAAPPTLRPYQIAFQWRIFEAMKTCRRVLGTAPTASGKRYVILAIAHGLAATGRRLLVVSDRRIITRQTQAGLDDHGVEHGVIMGDDPQTPEALIQVASIQTLQARGILEHGGKDLPLAGWMIIDECHKMCAAYHKLFSYYPDIPILGLTASPVGPDGRCLVGPDALYEVLVVGGRTPELIAQGHLLSTDVFVVSEPNMRGIRVSGGEEYNQKQLSERVDECTSPVDAFKVIDRFLGRKMIIFLPGLKYARGFTEQLCGHYGPGFAAVVEGATTKPERAELFEQFNDGDLQALCSVDVLKEGFDANASMGIDLQPNNQLRTFVQKTGRIRRPRGTHDKAIWIDLAGNYWKFPHPDEDIDWAAVTGDMTTKEMLAQRRAEGKEAKKIVCPKCGAERDRGRECPECGYIGQLTKRRVRMGRGQIKEVPIYAKKKKQASVEQREWDKARYMAHYTGKTLAQAKWFFKRNTGRWPPDGLRYMPERNSIDWDRKPADVYPWMDRGKTEVTV